MSDTSTSTPGCTPGDRNADARSPQGQESVIVEHLAAIRVLLAAIATHSPIQIPSEVLPRPRISTGEADPNETLYDEKEVIDYQFRQLPMKLPLESPEWDDMFFPFTGKLEPPTPTIHVPTRDGLPRGKLTNVLSWMLDDEAIRHGTYVDYSEFGYDVDGYVCNLKERPALGVGGLFRPRKPLGYRPRHEVEEHIVGLLQTFYDTTESHTDALMAV